MKLILRQISKKRRKSLNNRLAMTNPSTLFAEFKRNTKGFCLEEPFDFLIFRPIAFLIVKLTYSLPLGPNHFSFMALVVSLAAGYHLASGSAEGFVYGGVGIFIFSVLDCCDGMIARMKKNGSEYGNLIDMFVDLLSSTSFYVGLYLGLGKSSDFFPLHYFAMISAVFILIHVSIYNYYKKQYFFYAEGNPDGRNREIDLYRRNLDKLNSQKGRFFDKMLLYLFLLFSKAQKDSSHTTLYDVQNYINCNKKILPMWGVVAGSSHLALLSFSLMTHRVGIYFIFSIVLFNLWLVFVTVVQSGVNESIVVSK